MPSVIDFAPWRDVLGAQASGSLRCGRDDRGLMVDAEAPLP
jgi:hypothetical protein